MIRWLMSVWAWHFGGWDYRKHQCEAMHSNGGACIRCANHPGRHRGSFGLKW